MLQSYYKEKVQQRELPAKHIRLKRITYPCVPKPTSSEQFLQKPDDIYIYILYDDDNIDKECVNVYIIINVIDVLRCMRGMIMR